MSEKQRWKRRCHGPRIAGATRAARDKEGQLLLQRFRTSTAPLTPRCGTSGLRNMERLHFCGFSHPVCGTSAMAALFPPFPCIWHLVPELRAQMAFPKCAFSLLALFLSVSAPRSTSKNMGETILPYIF